MTIKEKVKAYFEENHGKVIDFGDLMENFDIPLSELVDICDKLAYAGEIKEVSHEPLPMP